MTKKHVLKGKNSFFDRLRKEFDQMIAAMQTPENVVAGKALFSISDQDIRDALVRFRDGLSAVGFGASQQSNSELPTTLIPLEEAERLTYPGVVSAFLDYAATGEGRTIGVLMLSANSAAELRKAVEDEWGAYFMQGVVVRNGNDMPQGYKSFYPHLVHDLIERLSERPPAFKFASTFHFNLA